MNRLRKQAFGKTLWHGTTLNFFKEIVNTGGIYPNENYGAGPAGADDTLFDGFSFFATDYDVAYGYALDLSIKHNNPAVVIEVDVSEDALLPDDNDAAGAKTWQESEKMVEQVKITGPVTTDYFRTIYFHDPDGDLVGESSFSQWESFYEEHSTEILQGNNSDDDEEYDEDFYNEYEYDFDEEDLDWDIEEDEEDWDSVLDNNNKYQYGKNKTTRLKKLSNNLRNR